MADEMTGTQPAEGATSGAPTGDEIGTQPAEGATSGAPTGEPQYSKADVDRAAYEARKSEKRAKDLQAQVEALQTQLKAREDADLTEAERTKRTAEEALASKQAAEQRAADAELRALRSEALAQHGADLPSAYKRLVAGDTEDEVRESITAARKTYDGDRQAAVAAALGAIATMTPEQLEAQYGEAGKALATRFVARPGSIGSAAAGATPQNGAAAGQPLSYEEIMRLPAGAQRDRALIGAWTAKPS